MSNLPYFDISRTSLEWLHIVFCHILGGDGRIEGVSIGGSPVLHVIGHEVLAGSNHFLDRRVDASL